jgi:hypothetical protein
MLLPGLKIGPEISFAASRFLALIAQHEATENIY